MIIPAAAATIALSAAGMPIMRTLCMLPLVSLAAIVMNSAAADTINVLTTGAFKQVVVAAVPAFEARTGHKVDVRNDTAGALVKRIGAGEGFDVVVLTPAPLDAMARDGTVAADSVVPLARVGIGVAVKAGAVKPPLATVDDFRQAVVGARKVAYIDPAAGGSSGIYLDKLFRTLGLIDVVLPKAVLVPGGLVAQKLVSGEADLAIHQISEILAVDGADLVAPLPEAIQNYTTYAGAVSARTSHADAARAFLATLSGPNAPALLRDKGMLPVR